MGGGGGRRSQGREGGRRSQGREVGRRVEREEVKGGGRKRPVSCDSSLGECHLVTYLNYAVPSQFQRRW